MGILPAHSTVSLLSLVNESDCVSFATETQFVGVVTLQFWFSVESRASARF